MLNWYYSVDITFCKEKKGIQNIVNKTIFYQQIQMSILLAQEHCWHREHYPSTCSDPDPDH